MLDDEYVNKKKRGIKCINEGYQRYLDNLNVLVNSYSFLSEDIIGTYKGNNIYRNFLNSNISEWVYKWISGNDSNGCGT